MLLCHSMPEMAPKWGETTEPSPKIHFGPTYGVVNPLKLRQILQVTLP